MASPDVGIKKQKLSGQSSDGMIIQNGVTSRNGLTPSIVHPEMGFYCFDVLYSQLHQLDPPKTPRFSNESQ